MKISVALAAYKGEEYIAEQLDSIIKQLGQNDEIIVSDDYPQGGTRSIVQKYANQDKRIIYIEGEGRGVVANFENALKACTGDVIFLCDQDDVWLPDKVSTVMAEIENGADLVLHDACVTDGRLKVISPSVFALYKTNSDYISNLIRNTFVGCCMAFTRQVMLDTLPFPKELPMHDWWIALAAIKKGRKVALLDKPLILWRRHGGNVTGGKTGLLQKIRWRAKMILSLARIK
ncbi:MAG: glycosyltransferase family 2 protein [Clostridia bacterium]|nr:glycosyltransferase family 2 protein [Clostridia bacterium]